jgi:aspartate kinase
MAYYGASVIHPKTLTAITAKKYSFLCKIFCRSYKEGTKVGASEKTKGRILYFKRKSDLLKISTRDFSFIAEDHMSLNFRILI